ncbi:MAG TPA: maleylacetoacetate isomerase [Steroidobacteraceae bacterium]|nr:maleylacetoacetate isomerase [Steroidobacteraceae bacterium]
MNLYTFFRSSAAYRVRIALNIKGCQYKSISKAFAKNEHRTREYLAINPQGLIPALDIDDHVLTQSLAIVEYLEETRPEPPLLPSSPLARAQVRAMTLAVACEIHPLNNLRALNYLRQHFGQSDDGVNTWYRHWVAEGFNGLEVMVASHSKARRYCFGDSVSMADIALAPQLYNARRFKCDLSPYPTLVAIGEHLDSLPAFAAAKPEAQPDAV